MIFIPGNVPSSKNSKTPITVNRNGKSFTTLAPSKQVKKYLEVIGIKKYGSKGVEGYKKKPNLFAGSIGCFFHNIEIFPVVLGFHFVRKDKHRFDFHNAVQILSDLFVAHGYLPDDDMRHFIPVPLICNDRWFSVNKCNPGVYIELVKAFDAYCSKGAEQMELFF